MKIDHSSMMGYVPIVFLFLGIIMVIVVSINMGTDSRTYTNQCVDQGFQDFEWIDEKPVCYKYLDFNNETGKYNRYYQMLNEGDDE